MKILILTRGRYEKKRQCTLENLQRYCAPDLLKFVWLACPEAEYDEYEKIWHQVYPCPVESDPMMGIAEVRQWYMDQAADAGERALTFLDDDLYFFARNPETWKLRAPEELNTMFTELRGIVDPQIEDAKPFPLASACERFFSNNYRQAYKCVTRQCRMHVMNPPLLRRLGVRWDSMRRPGEPTFVMEDYHVTLSLLERGWPNKVLWLWAQEQRQNNAKGGCSTYRTAAVQERSAHRLAELHPDTVSLKVKEGWRGMPERVDVRVQWWKAYEKAIKEKL